MEESKISIEQAEGLVREAISVHMSTISENNIGKINYSRINRIERIKGFMIEKISNKIQALTENLQIKTKWLSFFYSKYYTTQYHRRFVFARYFKGVPFFSAGGINELKRITDFVIKYPVQNWK